MRVCYLLWLGQKTLTSLGFRRVVLSRLRERKLGAPFASAQDCFQYCVRLLQYVVVPESDHLPPKGFKILRSGRVTLDFMLPAISFDDQLRFDTRKVGDVWAEGHLPNGT